jgi:hypothetical protein
MDFIIVSVIFFLNVMTGATFQIFFNCRLNLSPRGNGFTVHNSNNPINGGSVADFLPPKCFD